MPCASPFPFGSTSLGALDQMTDAELRRLPLPRVRDQAVAVDMEAYKTEGRLQELERTTGLLERLAHEAAREGERHSQHGLTDALARTQRELARTQEVRQWMQGLQDRLRAILDAHPQTRHGGRHN